MCGNWANTALSRRGERLGNYLLVENLLFFSLGGQFLLEVTRQGGLQRVWEHFGAGG